MTPHQSNPKQGWGTLMIDRRFRGVGRIKAASGTKEPAELQRIQAMLTTFASSGRLDLLIGLRDKLYSVPELYTAHRTDTLGRLPSAETLARLDRVMQTWARELPAGEHRRKIEQTLAHLLALDPDATVGKLPALLVRDRRARGATPVAFDRSRSHVSAFVRDTLTTDHPVYKAVRAVKAWGKAAAAKKKGRPLLPAELEAWCEALGSWYADAARSMAETGMGPKEYWEDGFEERDDRVVIHGKKRGGRERTVPRIGPVPTPVGSRDAFESRLDRVVRKLARRAKKTAQPLELPKITPYDFRRTHSNWMEAAGIPRTRRRLYRGHGPKDVGDLYEEHEVTAFLAEDRERLLVYLKRASASGVRLHA